MTERDENERLEEAAAEHAAHLSGETAGGRVDPGAAGERHRPEERPEDTGEGGVEGIGDLAGTGTRSPLGEQSTEGEAAREAVGAEPGDEEVEDRSTGEATREEVTGGQEG